MKLTLDAARSSVSVDLFAEGWLSALAHDLRLELRELQGSAERAEGAGGAVEGRGSLRAPTNALRFAGTLKKGQLDPLGLSHSDAREVERRVHDEHLGHGTLELEAELRGGRLALTVRGPKTRAPVSASFPVRVRVEGDAVELEGEGTLSLRALGVGEVKGPAGVFKLKDAAQVKLRARFVPA